MVVESEVLKAQNCALSKCSLPMHSNGEWIAKNSPRQSFGKIKFGRTNRAIANWRYCQLIGTNGVSTRRRSSDGDDFATSCLRRRRLEEAKENTFSQILFRNIWML